MYNDKKHMRCPNVKCTLLSPDQKDNPWFFCPFFLLWTFY